MHNLCKSNSVTALFCWVSFIPWSRGYGFFPSKTHSKGRRLSVCVWNLENASEKDWKSWLSGGFRENSWKLRSQHTANTLSAGCLKCFYRMLRQAQVASLATAPCQIQCEYCSNLPRRSLRLRNVSQNRKFAKLQTFRSVCLWSGQTMLHGKQKGVPRVVRQKWDIFCTLPLPFGQGKGAGNVRANHLTSRIVQKLKGYA